MTSAVRSYSRYATESLEILALSIRMARLEQKITASEVAERAGISRSLLQRIEKADPRCAIGVVFEVAFILGIPLFDAKGSINTLSLQRQRIEDRLSLLPQRARKKVKTVNDDF